MIDQILIYSRLEAGKQPLRIEELQLTKVINDLKDTFEFLCRQKGIELRWELPRDPLSIRSDATRLKEVVSNLLQNAVKYTDRGAITVRVGKHPSTDSATVEVQDTGMGISEQHLMNIFEPFMTKFLLQPPLTVKERLFVAETPEPAPLERAESYDPKALSSARKGIEKPNTAA